MIEAATSHPFETSGARARGERMGIRDSALLKYTLIGYVFFLPVQFELSETFRLAPSDLFLLFFLIFGFTRIRFVRSAWSVFHFALLGVFILGTARMAFDNPNLSSYVLLNKDLGILVLFASYAMIGTAARKWADIRWILRNLVIAVVVQTAMAVVALFATQLQGVNLPWINYGGTRVAGFLVNPNAFGGIVAVALLVHVVTYFSKRPLIRGLLGVVCMFVLAIGLLLTLSRSAWVGFLLASVLVGMVRPRLAAVFSILGALACVTVLVCLGSGKTLSLVTMAERTNTVQSRLDQADQALPLVYAHPILGIGNGAFIDRFGWIIHDTTLWMLTEFGLVGLSVYLCFCLWFFNQGWGAYRIASSADRPLVLALVCAHLCMIGVSIGSEALYERHWWLVMSLLASTLAVARKSRRFSITRRRGSCQPSARLIVPPGMQAIREFAP